VKIFSHPNTASGKDALAADDPAALARPADGAALLALICSPGLADKSWVTDQYHRYVRGDTVLAVPEDSAAPPWARPPRTSGASQVP
jgi:phosphoribosylformylglycinamidine (FGAM) synthase-like enzyme